jgi:small subunit ribosomal protein S17
MPKKILKGKVISDINEKTVVVLVERKYQHPFLKKIIKSKKKYHAHDEKNIFKIGDTVQIEESKPYSKNKRFKVLEENR